MLLTKRSCLPIQGGAAAKDTFKWIDRYYRGQKNVNGILKAKASWESFQTFLKRHGWLVGMSFNNLQVNFQQIPRWFWVCLYLFCLALRFNNTVSKGPAAYTHVHTLTHSSVLKPVSSCSQSKTVQYLGLFELLDKLLAAETGHSGNIYTTKISKHLKSVFFFLLSME